MDRAEPIRYQNPYEFEDGRIWGIFVRSSFHLTMSSVVPGGPKAVLRRRNNQDRQQTDEKPRSARSAGADGSSNTLLKLYTDEANGLNVDPVVVMVMALGFIFSVIALHVFTKLSSKLFG